jgi:phenylpyruvate tautomerase PptA (4-oxalocrotonate tautomerase family)
LAKALTDAFTSTTGAKPESVHIIFQDVNKDDWSVAGQLCSDRG